MSQTVVAQTSAESVTRISEHDRFHQLDDRQLSRRNFAITAGSALAIGLYGRNQWWVQGFNGKFTRQTEGWFGQNTYSGGADKLGHVYANYAGTRLFARAFEWAGNSRERALALAAWTNLGIYTAIEVLDGYSRNWYFSKEDAIMNVIGTGAAILMEKNPTLDQVLDFRLLYRPSNGSFDPVSDYSGQTYLLVLKASGFLHCGSIPFCAISNLPSDMAHVDFPAILLLRTPIRIGRAMYMWVSRSTYPNCSTQPYSRARAGKAGRNVSPILSWSSCNCQAPPCFQSINFLPIEALQRNSRINAAGYLSSSFD
ncbi:DUF2279 domain-containing protein [Noviherbaspirillum cavernae]|uniref:DUF2279 domain-containing protein n=1 Tax=Noviherbaspirillum cavernae TaxID=2320862 RepID=UPI001314D252|nr:DUF2279 domain-containing protein [Noviherbaspirillum cavernae]